LPVKRLHVVERESGSDYQDILLYELAQRFAEGEMRGRVETPQQRKLKRRDIGLRVHQFQRDKQAMIKSPLRINIGWDVIFFQVSRNPVCILRASWGWVGNFIRLIWETIIIIEHCRVLCSQQCCRAFFPMGADDQDSVWFFEPGWQLDHKIDHRFVARVTKNWQGTPTMAEIDNLGFILRAVLIHL